MPRTEARIFTSIWRDEDFLVLPGMAQRLYMFLLSQDDLAYCGVLPLRVLRWAKKSAGLSADEIERDLKWLEGTAYPSANPDAACGRTPFVITDRETGEVFIRSLIRRDGIWKQPNLMKQARETAEQVESPVIRGALLAELRRLPLEESGSALVRRVVEEFIQDLEKDGPYPPENPSENPSGKGSGSPSGDPSDDHTANPADNPSGDPSASPPQGYGEGNDGHQGVPQSPIPLFPGRPAPPRDRKTGTRIPDGFQPAPDMITWFREKCPHVDGKTEHEKFCDYWRSKPGKDGRKLDWAATWRNWMRTAEERSRPRQRAGPGRGTREAPADPRREWEQNRA